MPVIPIRLRRRQSLFKRVIAAAAWLAPLVAVPAFVGCDDESPATRSAWQRADELSEQIEAERQQHARELALVETRRVQAEDDTSAVNTILVSCAVTIVILILLLARERRCRRIVERLLRVLLDRIHGPRIAP